MSRREKIKVITFGEIMMRLNPEGYRRFVQAERFEASYSGGEANVAVSLAGYGIDAAFVSKGPAHEMGQCAVNALRRYGVDISLMVRGGVSTANIKEFMAEGFIHAVGGSWVCPKAEIAAGNFERITQLCKEAREAAVN